MKELSIEEKAKAYDKALAVARDFYNSTKYAKSHAEVKATYEAIFPELAESKDEKVRKALIHYMKDYSDGTGLIHATYGVSRNDAIAWLEKQGEMDMKSYKAAEDEKRKFIGDGFIKCYANFQDFKEGGTYWLEYVGNDNYNVRSDNLLGKTYHITPCQLYTIFKKQTWLEKKGEQKPTAKTEPKFKVGDIIRLKDGDGLEWTIEKVFNNGYYTIVCADRDDFILLDDNWELVEQKPAAWSEKDEKMLSDIIKDLVHPWNEYIPDRIEEEIKWLKNKLKSLRPQSTWKPSEEQMEALLSTLPVVKGGGDKVQGILESLYNDLKKLKE